MSGELNPAASGWLPDMDLNHDKQIQSLLCYRYTIGQAGAERKGKDFPERVKLLICPRNTARF